MSNAHKSFKFRLELEGNHIYLHDFKTINATRVPFAWGAAKRWQAKELKKVEARGHVILQESLTIL